MTTQQTVTDAENILSAYYDILVFLADENESPGKEMEPAALIAAATYEQSRILSDAIKEQTEAIKRMTEVIMYIAESINRK